MALSEQEVRHVAHLARLRLTDEEVLKYARQLSSILDFVRRLHEVDTSGVAPTAHPLSTCNVLRDDEPRPGCDAEAALALAPDRQDAFFRVPKVLDSGA